jgi:hypothetical protein
MSMAYVCQNKIHQPIRPCNFKPPRVMPGLGLKVDCGRCLGVLFVGMLVLKRLLGRVDVGCCCLINQLLGKIG